MSNSMSADIFLTDVFSQDIERSMQMSVPLILSKSDCEEISELSSSLVSLHAGM